MISSRVRTVLGLRSLAAVAVLCVVIPARSSSQNMTAAQLRSLERDRVILAAEKYVTQSPVTVTATRAARSAGGTHDYYSEGTYWWPNPKDPDGPYIRKDGLKNPENFVAHEEALRRFAIHIAGLTAAYVITGEVKYSTKAAEHLRAWFVTDSTRMNPNLLYAQAIKGIVTGRGIGIIDAIHLIEVAKSVMILEKAGQLTESERAAIHSWFRSFLEWLTTHPYGIDERGNGNNHSIWWGAQVAMYATLVGDEPQKGFCRMFYRDSLLGPQMTQQGTFPKELERTRPYSYSLFTLEGMATVCEVLTDEKADLWNMATEDGKTLRKAFEFLVPYIADKSKWTYPKDVAHFDDLPVRMQSLLFAGIAWKEKEYSEIWKKLNAEYTDEELVRTYPIRQPVLWVQ